MLYCTEKEKRVVLWMWLVVLSGAMALGGLCGCRFNEAVHPASELRKLGQGGKDNR